MTNKNPKSSLPATISKVTTMADGGIRLQVDTQELNNKDIATLFEEKGKVGWFFFDPEPITEIRKDDLPEIVLEEGEKSPSQRLRSVLYIYWEQRKLKQPFDSFYKTQMNKWIESIKEKLQ